MANVKVKEKNWDEVKLYTSISLSTEDIMVTLKNIEADFIRDLIEDRTALLKEVVYNCWYMYGVYDNVLFFGEFFKIISISKKKVELVRIEK